MQRKNSECEPKKNCDGSIQGDLYVINESKFSITFKSDDALPVCEWTLAEKIGTGVYGATFLATNDNAEADVSQIAVKAQLPNDYSAPDQHKYDIQEYENQHHLACRWNEELKRLPRSAARFPEVYFIGLYDSSPTSLTLFEKARIQRSVVAGMERFDCTLKKTLGDLLDKHEHEKIAELVNSAIVSVANTLQEVNQKNKMYFVHGDLHDGNIMHDESQENFYIIDFGASRININEKKQRPLQSNFFYKRRIGNEIYLGSRGLDLMTLCLNLVVYIRKPSIELNDTFEEKGLLSHLWYPLWNFFSSKPRGDYPPFQPRDSMGSFRIARFLDPKGSNFLATGKYGKKSDWPYFVDEEGLVVHFHATGKYGKKTDWPYYLETAGTPRELLNLAHIFGYTAGDGDETTLTFEPEKILSNNAVTDTAFMAAMRVYFTESIQMIRMLNRVVEEENRRASLCGQMSCVVSYMPQFRTFTLND
jgi:serine/threonine protein kinase